MSSKIIKKIFEENDDIVEADLKGEYVNLIDALIRGDMKILHKILGNDFIFLSEIVHNSLTEIDVDKLDYMKRDSFYVQNFLQIPTDCGVFLEG